MTNTDTNIFTIVINTSNLKIITAAKYSETLTHEYIQKQDIVRNKNNSF